MSAAEHRNAAEQQESFGVDDYLPGQEQASRHAEHAEAHRAAALELEAFEEEQCGRIAPESRHACPLLGKVVAVEDLDEDLVVGPGRTDRRLGARILFAEGVNMDAMLVHMRCHAAFARSRGRKGMDHCPLYIESVSMPPSTGEPEAPPQVRIPESDAKAVTPSASAASIQGGVVPPPRLRVERGSAPNSVDLVASDEADVTELRRRARDHVSP